MGQYLLAGIVQDFTWAVPTAARGLREPVGYSFFRYFGLLLPMVTKKSP